MVIVVMGVSGSGKSTVGTRLAEAIGCPFVEGDVFHPAANIAKMSRGIPLTDEDRAPWLAALSARIGAAIAAGERLVVTCSALKHSYRGVLAVDPRTVRFVHLKGEPALIKARLMARKGHFMKESLLASQLATLEEDADLLTFDAALPPDVLVGQIRTVLGV